MQTTRPQCTIQSQFSHKKQKKIGSYFIDGFCSHCNTVFEAMGCYCHFCRCQEQKPLLFEDIEKGLKKRERDNDRRDYLERLGYRFVEIWECQWKKWKTDNTNGVKEFVKKNHQFVPPLSKSALMNESNEKICSELLIVVRRFQRSYTPTLKIFLLFLRIVKLDEMTLEST